MTFRPRVTLTFDLVTPTVYHLRLLPRKGLKISPVKRLKLNHDNATACSNSYTTNGEMVYSYVLLLAIWQ